MLNWLLRYAPVLDLVEEDQPANVLEVGSGTQGVAHYLDDRFVVGVDVRFDGEPAAGLAPVLSSAAALPFGDETFDLVVCCDVLEHIAADQRVASVKEMLRVTRKTLVIGFPVGPLAMALDRKLADKFAASKKRVPSWLSEHLETPYPSETLVPEAAEQAGLLVGAIQPNTNLRLHEFVIRAEHTRVGRRVLPQLSRPTIIRRLGPLLHQGSVYRFIYVVRRPDTYARQD